MKPKNKFEYNIIVFASVICVIAVLFHKFYWPHFATFFIVAFVLERVYESFFTYKNTAGKEKTNDKYLKRVVTTYSVMILATVLDFYLNKRSILLSTFTLGFVLLSISLVLRFSAISKMGNNWAIDTFAVPTSVVRQVPYSIVRHPYYLGVFFETLSFALVLNSPLGLILSLFVVIPLEAKRGLLEEITLTKYKGWEYIRYKCEVNRFIPTFVKKECYDRRNSSVEFSHPDRRIEERRKVEGYFEKDRRKVIS